MFRGGYVIQFPWLVLECTRNLGSKVRISGFYPQFCLFLSRLVITHLLTIDPNLLGHPSHNKTFSTQPTKIVTCQVAKEFQRSSRRASCRNSSIFNSCDVVFCGESFHMGVSEHRGKTPKWMVKIMENPIKMDDLGVPLFLETSIYTH